MYRNALVVSNSLDLCSVAKIALRLSALHGDCKFAHDSLAALALIKQELFDLIIADDDTVKNFVENCCCDPKIHNHAFILKLRTGGRLNIRRRESPFRFTEILFENLGRKEQVQVELLRVFADLAQAKGTRAVLESSGNEPERSAPLNRPVALRKVNPELFLPEVIVIGASTGGPEALERFFVALPFEFVVPVVVVQHMPSGFTKNLAERLGRVSGFRFLEARNNQPIEAGHVYIAPGDFHLRLKRDGEKVRCNLDRGQLINSVRPAVDPMFESAAEIFGHKVMGIVFTGMGEDGAVGSRTVKEQGGCVAIQDEASCVVFGMPGAIAQMGIQDFSGSPEELATMIGRQMNLKGAVSTRNKRPDGVAGGLNMKRNGTER